MKIIDTIPGMTALLHDMNGRFDLAVWEGYAASISKALPLKIKEDSKNYHFERDVLPVLENAMNNRKALERAHDSFLTVTSGIKERSRQLFGMDLQVDIILYLGLCNGAGWATTLDDQKAILLGVEKIIELNWCDARSMAGLIYHELGHIWHDTAGTLRWETENQSDRSVWQLFQEGVAMVCQQLLCCDSAFYHQDQNGWLAWCMNNQEELLDDYNRRVHAAESTQDFFGDWRTVHGRSDVGYFLGCQFVKWLMIRYTLHELAGMGLPLVKEALDRFTRGDTTPDMDALRFR